MAVTTYRAANFQDGLTLNMPGGTGTGVSTWTLNQSTASLPSGTFRFLVYTDIATFSTTKEICEGVVTGANTVNVTLRNAEGDTTAVNHPNGSIFAIVNTAGMENAQNDAIADLYTTGGTAIVTSGEAYAATTFVTNNAVNQAYSLPTLLYEDSSTGRWFKMAGTAALGAHTRIGMAYELSSVAAASVRIYLPGSSITVSAVSASEVGRTFTNSLTSGACESTVLPPYYTYIGFFANTTTFKFTGYQVNNVLNTAITVPVTSGEAFSVRDALYLSTDGKAYKAVSNTSRRAGGWYSSLIAAQAASAADQTVQAYPPGSIISGYSGLTPGAEYYTSTTAGTLIADPGHKPGYAIGYGFAMSSSILCFNTREKNDNSVTNGVVAGENWTAGDLLYFKKSDSRFYRADADVAESGICEYPAIAAATHTAGAGTFQIVFLPGSLIFATIGGTIGDRVYPSSTTGGYSANTPASYDTFYRQVGMFILTSILHLVPQEMQFLPTGIQEKGFTSTGGNVANGVVANIESRSGVNFKKVMVNTPSSITLTSTATSNITSGPTANSITRFGFSFTAGTNTTGNHSWYWEGTYQTVGN